MIIKSFIFSLITTIFLETVSLFLINNFLTSISKDKLKILLWGIFASSLTLPYVHFVFPYFLYSHSYIIFAESFAILVETIFYKHYFNLDFKTSFLMSLLSNSLSFGIWILLLW